MEIFNENWCEIERIDKRGNSFLSLMIALDFKIKHSRYREMRHKFQKRMHVLVLTHTSKCGGIEKSLCLTIPLA